MGLTEMSLMKSLRRLVLPDLRHLQADFAFVLHALSHKDYWRVPSLKYLKYAPDWCQQQFENAMGMVPGLYYGVVKDIYTPHREKPYTGVVYGLMGTPKILKSQDPQSNYDKMISIAENARYNRIPLIGLGAYTKAIGDAGVTVAQKSPIPVTTGNSLSAAATIWSLKVALERVGWSMSSPLSPKPVLGVIGATGSVGSVCAKYLSRQTDSLVLIAPSLQKLKKLKAQIQKISPHCEVRLGTDADAFAYDLDAMITATTAQNGRVLNIQRLKPGCIVCDCSRPLDFTKQQAQLRPDVLLMQSGELMFSQPTRSSCDMGLPKDIYYACFVEAALLSMEQRWESYSLGRQIDWQKVSEILAICNKHGVQLAPLRSPLGWIEDNQWEFFRRIVSHRIAERSRKRSTTMSELGRPGTLGL